MGWLKRWGPVVCLAFAACDESKTTKDDADKSDAAVDAGADAGPERVSRCEGKPEGAPLKGKAVAADGPYMSKIVAVTLVDTTRPTPMTSKYAGAATRTLETSIWYPADADGNLAEGGPFPLIVWSHGFTSTRFESDYVSPHLASRGYIIAAPAFPLTNLAAPGGPQGLDFVNQPGDVRFIIDSMLAKSADENDLLAGGIDPDRIGLSGLSVGAATTLVTTYHVDERDPRIKAAVALAGPGRYYGPKFFEPAADVPLLISHGTIDAVIPYEPNAKTLFESARGPVWLAKIEGGTHTAFTGFASSEQPDSLGCDRIDTTNSMRDDDGGPDARYEQLGGTEAGFNLPPPPEPDNAISCATKPLPPSISGARQHALTTLLLTSFFDMHLSKDEELRNLSCQYLEETVAAENEELELTTR